MVEYRQKGDRILFACRRFQNIVYKTHIVVGIVKSHIVQATVGFLFTDAKTILCVCCAPVRQGVCIYFSLADGVLKRREIIIQENLNVGYAGIVDTSVEILVDFSVAQFCSGAVP